MESPSDIKASSQEHCETGPENKDKAARLSVVSIPEKRPLCFKRQCFEVT